MNNEEGKQVEAASTLNDRLGDGWMLYDNGHVIPVDDVWTHKADSDCWCHPTLDNGVFVHHSCDGRELFEKDYRPGVNMKLADA